MTTLFNHIDDVFAHLTKQDCMLLHVKNSMTISQDINARFRVCQALKSCSNAKKVICKNSGVDVIVIATVPYQLKLSERNLIDLADYKDKPLYTLPYPNTRLLYLDSDSSVADAYVNANSFILGGAIVITYNQYVWGIDVGELFWRNPLEQATLPKHRFSDLVLCGYLTEELKRFAHSRNVTDEHYAVIEKAVFDSCREMLVDAGVLVPEVTHFSAHLDEYLFTNEQPYLDYLRLIEALDEMADVAMPKMTFSSLFAQYLEDLYTHQSLLKYATIVGDLTAFAQDYQNGVFGDNSSFFDKFLAILHDGEIGSNMSVSGQFRQAIATANPTFYETLAKDSTI